ncbi:hypothetical protein Bca101_057659 [Brassica carinata]
MSWPQRNMVSKEPTGYNLPQFLQDIVGKIYIFHLKLTEFNFSSPITPSLSPESVTLIRGFQGLPLHRK